jgi:hypothetical protein
VYGYVQGNPQENVDPDGRQSSTAVRGVTALCTAALIEPTPFGEVACICALGAVAILATPAPKMSLPKPCRQACSGNNTCMADRPRGFWPGDRGAEEWGRRNGMTAAEARRRFHRKKQQDKGRGKDDYSVNPETGDIADPSGEVVDNMHE